MFSFSVIFFVPLCLRQAWHLVENFEYLIDSFRFLSQEIIPSCLRRKKKKKNTEKAKQKKCNQEAFGYFSQDVLRVSAAV